LEIEMGLFLAITGVANVESAAVEAALHEFAGARGGSMEQATTNDADDRLVIAKSEAGNVTVVYPSDFMGWDDAARFLSETLGAVTISLHIHDEDLWMYVLVDGGKDVDWFNPIPNYWGNVSSGELTQWAGNAATLARHWPRLSADAVENYLVSWDFDGFEEKAYPEDEFPRGDCWQLVDFMNKLQLVYPDSDVDTPDKKSFEFQV
jgi:hypothetical protein